jgi:hypothetical protein
VRRALVGSLIAHGVLGALLLSIGGSDRTPPPATIDIVEIVEAPKPVPPPSPTIVAKLESGGGGRPAPLRPKATVRPAAHTLREAFGDIAIEGGTGDGGTGGGDGGGIGRGHGRGIGLGEDGAVIQTIALPTPPAAPVSKARPPKLIYPKHEHGVGNGDDLLVARVTIDRDGFVVGAKLVRRLHDRRDEAAQSAIFRFRYAPALDDDGRAITATIDQPFMLE